MARTVQWVETRLQTRLRATSLTISSASLYDVMDKVQKTLNHALVRKVTTGTLTLSTASAQSFYYTSAAIGTDCIRPLAVYLSSRTVMETPGWGQIQQYDRNWFNATGTRLETWSPVGHNMIAVYPSVVTADATTYTCVYLQDTTTLNSTADTFNLADDDIDLVLDLCEIVWLSNLRLYPEVKAKVEKFQRTIAPYVGGQ